MGWATFWPFFSQTYRYGHTVSGTEVGSGNLRRQTAKEKTWFPRSDLKENKELAPKFEFRAKNSNLAPRNCASQNIRVIDVPFQASGYRPK
jgi:hypothetical protein